MTVTLDAEDADTKLIDKILVVLVYSREGKLMYRLNIVPAYFTVDKIFLAEHANENPVLINKGNVNDPEWLESMNLNFISTSNENITLPDNAVTDFRDSLNTSGLVSRKHEDEYITLLANIDYQGGYPVLVNRANSTFTIENVYRYELIDTIPEATYTQAIGVVKDGYGVYCINKDKY